MSGLTVHAGLIRQQYDDDNGAHYCVSRSRTEFADYIPLLVKSLAARLYQICAVQLRWTTAVAEAIYSEYATAGWTTSLDVPKLQWPKQNDVFWQDPKPYSRGTVIPFTYRVARVYIHMPDGSSHELRKSDIPYHDQGSIDMVGTFYAVDGSRLRYDSTGANTGTLYLADGTRYILNGSTTQVIDRNGNTLNSPLLDL